MGHIGVEIKEMGATYLRPLEVEIQIAFSFGLSGSSSMSIFLLLFSPTRPVWFGMIFFFFSTAVVDPISNSEL